MKDNLKQLQQHTDSTRSIAESVMQSIESERVSMKPKWQFTARESMLWIIAAAAILIGAIAFSVILYSITNTDYDLYMRSNVGAFGGLLRILPYFWIILLLVFVVAIEWNVKHTKKGYKYKTSIILAASILCSVILGTILYAVQIGKAIDYALEERLPYYAGYMSPRHSAWINPESGVLAGRVVTVQEEFILIETVRGQEWKVIFIDTGKEPLGFAQIQTDRHIRVVGEQVDEYLFKAYEWKLQPEDEPFGLNKKRPPRVHVLTPAQ